MWTIFSKSTGTVFYGTNRAWVMETVSAYRAESSVYLVTLFIFSSICLSIKMWVCIKFVCVHVLYVCIRRLIMQWIYSLEYCLFPGFTAVLPLIKYEICCFHQFFHQKDNQATSIKHCRTASILWAYPVREAGGKENRVSRVVVDTASSTTLLSAIGRRKALFSVVFF